MSKIGKAIINIPKGVEVAIDENLISVKGPKGQLSRMIDDSIKVEIKDDSLTVSPKAEDFGYKIRSLWGTTRALLANMVRGVSEMFEKKLEIEGIGFKSQLQGEDLVLNVGFSHPVTVKCPDGIIIKTEKNTITVSGCDKELVGRIAAEIRRVKKPEPYKGTGIRYAGEIIKKKAGKKATSTA